MPEATVQIPECDAKKMPKVIDLAVWYRDAVLHSDQTALRFFYNVAPDLRKVPIDPLREVYCPGVMNVLQNLKESDLVILREELEHRHRPWLTEDVRRIREKIAPRREL